MDRAVRTVARDASRLVTAPGAVRSPAARLAPGALARSVGMTLTALVVAGLLLRLVFRGSGAGPAIAASAGVTLVVQLLSFIAARAAPPRQVLAVWVAGTFVRLLTLVVYALGAVRLLAFPPAPALLSLATFFFVTTLAESRLHLR